MEFLEFMAIFLIPIIIVGIFVVFCPIILIVLIGGIVYAIWKNAEKDKAEAEAETARRLAIQEEEKRRYDEKKRREDEAAHNKIREDLKSVVSEKTTDFEKLADYLTHTDLKYQSYVVGLVKPYETKIAESAQRAFEKFDYQNMVCLYELLAQISPMEEIYIERYQKGQRIKSICEMQSCYILESDYGEPKKELIQQILKEDSIEVRKNKDENNILTFLWYSALQEPFDQAAFKEAVDAANCLKPAYAPILLDEMLALLYVEKKYGEKTATKFCEGYRGILDSYIETGNSEGIMAVASMAFWLRDTYFEACALKKLHLQGGLSEMLEKRYQAIKFAVN